MTSRERTVLALDASGDCPSACVLAGGTETLRVGAPGDRAGLVLHRLMLDALAAAGAGLGDVALVAVTRGPGSFTGLRVGLAAAQGLALGLAVPATGIETTRAVAEASGLSGDILVLLEGGQGRLFVGLHRRGSSHAETLAGPDDLAPADALARVREHHGPSLVRGVPACAAELLAAGGITFDGPLAAAAARLALVTEPATDGLQALYARAPAIRPASQRPA